MIPDAEQDEQSQAEGAVRQRVVVALSGYLLVAVFGLVYAIVRHEWPKSPVGTAIVAGVLAAAPAAVALIWERLTGMKAFGLELTLAQATVPVEQSLSFVLSSTQYFSAATYITNAVQEVIEHRDIRLVEVNLRSQPYWWSTRLFLQAALLDDYSSVDSFVFVENDATRHYVAMASPGELRAILAVQFPSLEQVYSNLRPGAAGNIQALVNIWAGAQFPSEEGAKSEGDAKVLLTSKELLAWLPDFGRGRQVVELNDVASARRLRTSILRRHCRFVALVRDRRLVRVVDADALALGSLTQTGAAKEPSAAK